MSSRLFARSGIALVLIVAALPLGAQGRGQSRPIVKAPGATPPALDSAPAYVRRSAPTDAGINRIYEEGMQRSQVAKIAQVLLDSIGPRLTGSPNMTRAQDWAVSLLKSWGVDAKKEQYGTWNAWKRGSAYASLRV
jgi:hypothetical protein